MHKLIILMINGTPTDRVLKREATEGNHDGYGECRNRPGTSQKGKRKTSSVSCTPSPTWAA